MKKYISIFFVIVIVIIIVSTLIFFKNRNIAFKDNIWEKYINCEATSVDELLINEKNSNLYVFYTGDDWTQHCVRYDANGNKIAEKTLNNEKRTGTLVQDIGDSIAISSSTKLEDGNIEAYLKIYDYDLNEKESYTFEPNSNWLFFNYNGANIYCLTGERKIIEFNNGEARYKDINYGDEIKDDLKNYNLMGCVTSKDGFVVLEYGRENDEDDYDYITYKIDFNGTMKWSIGNENHIMYNPLNPENDKCVMMVYEPNDNDINGCKVVRVNNRGYIESSSILLNEYFPNSFSFGISPLDDKYILVRQNEQFENDYYILSNDLKEISNLDINNFVDPIFSIEKNGENFIVIGDDVAKENAKAYIVTNNMLEIKSHKTIQFNDKYKISNIVSQDGGISYILSYSNKKLALTKLGVE